MRIAVLVMVFVPGAFSASSVGAQDVGTIIGRVIFEGKPPEPEVLEVAQDREVCGREIVKMDLVVNEGGIQNAVVRITSLPPATESFSMGKALVDQAGCRFLPHVLLMAPGRLTILNSDGIMHNVHTYPEKNMAKNVAMPKFKKRLRMNLEKPEIIPIRCDAHGWMRGYVVVAEHRYYAVTDETGEFRIEDIREGEHTIEVWHERLGTMSQPVNVKSGETTEVTFVLSDTKK